MFSCPPWPLPSPAAIIWGLAWQPSILVTWFTLPTFLIKIRWLKVFTLIELENVIVLSLSYGRKDVY